MNSQSKPAIGTSAKIFFVIFIVLFALRLNQYVFYKHEIRDLVGAIGFALLSYGIVRNGLGKVMPSKSGRYASIVGGIMVIASFAMRYLA